MNGIAALLPYISQDRAAALAGCRGLPGRARGSALFADISGFTSLTEFLRDRMGPRRGAEELSRRLDETYAALIAQVEREGGSVIGFAGDAITCWFDAESGGGPADETAEETAKEITEGSADRSAALRAVTCAFGLQEAMLSPGLALEGLDGARALGIKVAVASGEASRIVAGDPAIRLHDELGGATIARMAAGERLAKSGEVLADLRTTELLGIECAYGEPRSDNETGELFRPLLEPPKRRNPPEEKKNSAPEGDELDPDSLRPWMIESVFRRESSEHGVFLAEFRPCVALFVNFAGIDYDGADAATKLDLLVRRLQDVASRRGGELLQVTIGDKGSYAYFAFGAITAHEDDSRRAVDAALELRFLGTAEGLSAHPRCGISRGTLFVGSYGGPTRRTFSALGDEVNIAARLMQSAGAGEVLATGRVHYSIGSAYEFDEGATLMVKGKTEPIQAFSISGARHGRSVRLQEPVYALPMSGRTSELASLREGLDEALKGRSQAIAIIGEAGLGKSRLLAEAVRLARRRSFACYGGACQSDGARSPYLPWRSIWSALLDIDPDAPLRRRLRSLEAALEDFAPGRSASIGLLAPLLGMPIPDAEAAQRLGAEGRKTALHNLLGDCLAAAAKEEPLLIVLEDFHWVDELSLELLGDLVRRVADSPVAFLVASRPMDVAGGLPALLANLPASRRIELRELPRDECGTAARAKWSQLFPASTLQPPRVLIEAILDRAQGNPFFVEELLNYVRDRGVDISSESALASFELPESVQTLILSRIDRLSDRERVTLKVASVIGRQFRASWLPGYYPAIGDLVEVKKHLSVLEGIDITPLDSPEPELAYLFKHIMTHEVAYETLPYEMRADLHERLAAWLEDYFADEPPLDALAFHYARTANAAKRREFLRKAGDAARDAFANEAALEYYRRLQGELDEPAALAGLLIERGDILDTVGRVDEAEAEYRAARVISEGAGDARIAAKATHLAGAMMALRSQSENALEWLGQADRAYAALGDEGARANVINDAGLVFARKGELQEAADRFETALALARGAGARLAASASLNYLGSVAHARGDYVSSRRSYEESLQIKRELGEVNKIANTLNNLGGLLMDQGEFADAQAFLGESLALRRKMGDKAGIASCLANLGMVRHHLGLLDEGKAFYIEAIGLFRELGDQGTVAMVLGSLGVLTNEEGDLEAARAALVESLGLQRNVGDSQGTVWGLVGMAYNSALRGEARRAILIAASAEALRASKELALDPLMRRAFDAALSTARAALTQEEIDEAKAAGSRLDAAAAIEAALRS